VKKRKSKEAASSSNIVNCGRMSYVDAINGTLSVGECDGEQRYMPVWRDELAFAGGRAWP